MNKWSGSGNPDFAISLDGNAYPCAVFTVGGNQYFCGDQSPAPTVGVWYHFAATYNYGVGLQFYLNGQPCGPLISVSGALQNTSQNIYIGQAYGGANPVNAVIANAIVYARCLAAAEILADYNNPPLIVSIGNALLTVTGWSETGTSAFFETDGWKNGAYAHPTRIYGKFHQYQFECVEQNVSWANSAVPILYGLQSSGSAALLQANHPFRPLSLNVIIAKCIMNSAMEAGQNIRRFTVDVREYVTPT
jgi:hypothetical protein